MSQLAPTRTPSAATAIRQFGEAARRFSFAIADLDSVEGSPGRPERVPGRPERVLCDYCSVESELRPVGVCPQCGAPLPGSGDHRIRFKIKTSRPATEIHYR